MTIFTLVCANLEQLTGFSLRGFGVCCIYSGDGCCTPGARIRKSGVEEQNAQIWSCIRSSVDANLELSCVTLHVLNLIEKPEKSFKLYNFRMH